MVIDEMRPKVAMALGGGSVRGLAHIGVLQVLEKAGIHVDMIAGTSMGAVIGAIYAAGTDLNYLARLVARLSWDKLLDLREIGFAKLGLIDGSRFERIIELLLRKKNFNELKIPLRIVATNLVTGGEVVFEKGDLIPALRASISIPGLFIPVAYNETDLLVDGGIVAGVPVKAAREMGADLTIAVYVGYDIQQHEMKSILDVLIQVVDIMMARIDSVNLSMADLIIAPEVGQVGVSRFDKTEFCIEQGRKAAVKALPQINEFLEKSASGSHGKPPRIKKAGF
ncbi:MAG: patatin-like phospholipase family protein [Bacillota bacterium]